MEFENRTAIISGAASGIGRLCAEKLAAEGANVIVADVNLDAADAVVKVICQNGGKAIAVKVDVRNYEQVKSASEAAMMNFGHIDILINCAGGASTRVFGISEGFKDIDIKVIDWGLDVNLKGAVYFCHAVIGHMIDQKKGVIINLGSIDGETGSLCIDYGTAKSAMNGLTKSLAIYGAPYGVRACCVSPGPVLTRPAMAKMPTLLGRAAQPQEVVDLILYLCSDSADFITGTNYLIDGGRNCGVTTRESRESK